MGALSCSCLTNVAPSPPPGKPTLQQIEREIDTLVLEAASLCEKMYLERERAQQYRVRSNRAAALPHVILFKRYKAQYETALAAMRTLNTQLVSIHKANLNVDVSRIQKMIVDVLGQATEDINVEEVADMAAELQVNMEDVEAVQTMLGQPLTEPDKGELAEEWNNFVSSDKEVTDKDALLPGRVIVSDKAPTKSKPSLTTALKASVRVDKTNLKPVVV